MSYNAYGEGGSGYSSVANPSYNTAAMSDGGIITAHPGYATTRGAAGNRGKSSKKGRGRGRGGGYGTTVQASYQHSTHPELDDQDWEYLGRRGGTKTTTKRNLLRKLREANRQAAHQLFHVTPTPATAVNVQQATPVQQTTPPTTIQVIQKHDGLPRGERLVIPNASLGWFGPLIPENQLDSIYTETTGNVELCQGKVVLTRFRTLFNRHE